MVEAINFDAIVEQVAQASRIHLSGGVLSTT